MAGWGIQGWGTGDPSDDDLPPGILFDPPSGTEIEADDTIGIEVADNVGVAFVMITAEFPSGAWDVVYNGASFSGFYPGSSVVPVGSGFEFTIVRTWPLAPTLRVYAIDAAGNMAQAVAVYTLAALPAPEPGPVTIEQVDPILDTDGLRLAVLMSLFSDRRAPADAWLPGQDGDRRGWWADQFASVPGDQLGSHLWLLDRATNAATDNAQARAEQYAVDALAWLLEDRVASRVTVVATVTTLAILLEIEIERPHDDPAAFRFQHSWDSELTTEQLPPILM